MQALFITQIANIEGSYEGEEDVDYKDKIVISFFDKYTCISNYDMHKIYDIRFQLITFGIIKTEIRKKQIGNKTLYTVVYDNQQNVNRIDWNQ